MKRARRKRVEAATIIAQKPVNYHPTIAPRRVEKFCPADIAAASEQLRSDGFSLTVAPIELIANGALLTAWHEERRDGFVITASEVGLVARLGSAALDPYREGSNLPRWARTDQANRHRKYAEATLANACAIVAATPEGGRQVALSRAAFTVGRLLADTAWGISEADAAAALEDAARACGLKPAETERTIQRGFRDGRAQPRDPLDVAGTTNLTNRQKLAVARKARWGRG